MSNLSEQQECKIWDRMTELARYADKVIRSLAMEVDANYDYVRGVFEQMLDADFRVPKYYITKKSRNEPYIGSTWSKAGYDNPVSKYFDNKTYAEYLAEQLSKFNPAGFKVVEALEDEY